MPPCRDKALHHALLQIAPWPDWQTRSSSLIVHSLLACAGKQGEETAFRRCLEGWGELGASAVACGWSRWPSRRVAQASDERRMSAPAKEIQRCIAARLPQRLRNASRTRPVLWRHKMCSRQRPMKQTDDWAVSNVARVPACTHACAAPRLRSSLLAQRAVLLEPTLHGSVPFSDPCRCGRDPRSQWGGLSALPWDPSTPLLHGKHALWRHRV